LQRKGCRIPAHRRRRDAEFAELTAHERQQAKPSSCSHLTIRRQQGSLDLIGQNAESWRGGLQNTDRLIDLVLTAMKSDDLRVRGAAIEVDLAANNLSKTPRTDCGLLKLIRKIPPSALRCALGAANRGRDELC